MSDNFSLDQGVKTRSVSYRSSRNDEHIEENAKIAMASSSVISLLYCWTSSTLNNIFEVRARPEVVLIDGTAISTD